MQETIIKTDNELIAEFMGATLERATSGGKKLWSFVDMPSFCKQIDIPESRVRVFYAEDLEFDKSWDWLMPVVEKIQTPEVKNNTIIREAADVSIYYKNCHIQYTTDDLDYDLHPDGVQGETKIEAVYKAVVEFIKWYT